MTVKLPFIKWRDGRPRLVHGPRERAQGFLDRDLRHEGSGAWFTFEEAKAFSETHLAEIHKARQSKKIKVRDEPPAQPLTIEDLLNDWFNSREVQSLAPASISSYSKAMRAVLYRPESREEAKARRRQGILETAREREAMATVTPSAVGAPELRAFFNHLRQVRGHTMALAAIATLSAAFTRGRESTKWRLGVNPRLDMQFDRPDGRVVLITLPEFLAVVAAGDAAGRPSIGDAQYLGLFTGQRLIDRLAMMDEGLVEGRRHLRQSKTGQLVAIKEAPQLAARLALARRRVTELKVKHGLREMPQQIVIDETTGRPYSTNAYRHVFTDMRDLATFGFLAHHSVSEALARSQKLAAAMTKGAKDLFAPFPIEGEQRQAALAGRARALAGWLDEQAARDGGDWRLAPCPTLAFVDERAGNADLKNDQDLRDTCVMLLDAAGNDLLSICDVTGHSYQSAQMIMKHYRARNAARADVAIDKLVAFIGKGGAG